MSTRTALALLLVLLLAVQAQFQLKPARSCSASGVCVFVVDEGSSFTAIVEGPENANYMAVGFGDSVVLADMYVSYKEASGQWAFANRLMRAQMLELHTRPGPSSFGEPLGRLGVNSITKHVVLQFRRLKAPVAERYAAVNLTVPLNVVWAWSAQPDAVTGTATNVLFGYPQDSGVVTIDLNNQTQVTEAQNELLRINELARQAAISSRVRIPSIADATSVVSPSKSVCTLSASEFKTPVITTPVAGMAQGASNGVISTNTISWIVVLIGNLLFITFASL